MKSITKKYSNGEVTIVWKPDMCIHSGICFRGLPEVFDPRRRPWVEADKAATDKIVEQIRQCPSGALSYYMNHEDPQPDVITGESIVEVAPNGPLLVYGNLTIKDNEGNITKKNKVTAFCRCGHSGNKPYCDGSHQKAGFTG